MDYTNKLHVIFDDGMLGVGGANFHYLFGYERAGIESLVVDGHEWMYRVPQPTFWRATTDNDRGSRFNIKSAQWLAADYVSPCVNIQVAIDGQPLPELPIAPLTNQYTDHDTATTVTITYTYQTPTVPATTVDVAYTVLIDGTIEVRSTYHGQADLPQLPVFGWRMQTPTPVTEFTYHGLSGETYPDRMAGASEGTYTITGMPVTPYLVPQENGMHMQTDWVELTRETTLNNADLQPGPFKLRISSLDQPFNFSCLPYTSLELENATHHEELPPVRRAVIVIAGAVRGVGGIDSWGSDVERAYHLPADQDYQTNFKLELVP